MEEKSFKKTVKEKINQLNNPFEFLKKSDHLIETGALSRYAIDLIKNQANTIVEDLMDKHEISRIAILVDTSVSMETAKTASIHLFNAFTRLKTTVTHLISFDTEARQIELEELKYITPKGKTSIGAAFKHLFDTLREEQPDQHPQVILLITDYEENTKPYLKDVLVESKFQIPFLTIRVEGRRNLKINDYPHTVMVINDYHGSFVINYIKEIIYLMRQLIDAESETSSNMELSATKKSSSKFILEDEIRNIEPKKRPNETLQPGYSSSLLIP